MGFFSSKNYNAEQVKELVRPTLNIAESVIAKFESIEISIGMANVGALVESEYNQINDLREVLSQIYLYYGVSTHQAGEMIALLNDKRISPMAMEAVNNSFILYAKEFTNFERQICEFLKSFGYSHIAAIDFHKQAWENSVGKNPNEMATLLAVRNNRKHWDWINSESWKS
jgi:hypothetical protein